MLAIIKNLFINKEEEKTTEVVIQTPAWSETYPRYYKMLKHEFASDGFRFQKDVIDPINATFEFINNLAIDAPQKEKIKELCIANAAFSARAANGFYFSRKRKDAEHWGHEKWRRREHEWQYAVFHAALFINLFKDPPSGQNTNLKDFAIDINDEEIALSINSAIHDSEHETMPHQFYPLIKRMFVKTSDFLNTAD